jgi:hypothetical protein
MNSNVKPSDRAAIVGNIDPDAYAAGTYTTGWINMADFLSIMAIVQAGTLGSSATVDAKLEQATSAAGAGAKDVTGKAITQLTQAGTDSDKQAVINLFANELDINNGFTHARLSITVGTATSDAGGIVIGFDPVKDVASANDAATVDEIV